MPGSPRSRRRHSSFPLTPTSLGAPQRQIAIPRTAGAPVVTADGGYVAFVVAATNESPARAAYVDRLTGTLHVIAGLIPAGELFSDPSAVRLLLVADGTISIVEPGGVRSVTISPIDTRVRPALSADGRELYAVRPRAETSVSYRIVVLDPLTGAEMRSLPELYSTSVINLAVSGDNERLFVSTSYPNTGVRVLDSHSGAELATRGPLGGSPIGVEGFGEITVTTDITASS